MYFTIQLYVFKFVLIFTWQWDLFVVVFLQAVCIDLLFVCSIQALNNDFLWESFRVYEVSMFLPVILKGFLTVSLFWLENCLCTCNFGHIVEKGWKKMGRSVHEANTVNTKWEPPHPRKILDSLILHFFSNEWKLPFG